LGDEVKGGAICLGKDLGPRMSLDLGEFMIHKVGVHRLDLHPAWCPQDFDDFYQLVDSRLTAEEGSSQHQLSHDTTSGPHIYGERVRN
jgi:hypothetical protein